MNIREKIVFSVSLAFILFVALFAYFKPYIIQANLFFIFKNEALVHIVKLFQEHENVVIMKKNIKGGYSFENSNKEVEIIEPGELDRYGDLAEKSNISPIRRLSNKISFFVGSKRKFNKTFNISYDYFFDAKDIEISCDNNSESEKHGICTYLLDQHWVLRYEWIAI